MDNKELTLKLDAVAQDMAAGTVAWKVATQKLIEVCKAYALSLLPEERNPESQLKGGHDDGWNTVISLIKDRINE